MADSRCVCALMVFAMEPWAQCPYCISRQPQLTLDFYAMPKVQDKTPKKINPVRFARQYSEVMRASLSSLPNLDISEKTEKEVDDQLELLFAKEDLDIDDLLDFAGLMYAQACILSLSPDDEEEEEDDGEEEEDEDNLSPGDFPNG